MTSQALGSLREERLARSALQQQLAQLQEDGQAAAQGTARLEAQSAQLATQVQHAQATSHTLQKLIQVTPRCMILLQQYFFSVPPAERDGPSPTCTCSIPKSYTGS